MSSRNKAPTSAASGCRRFAIRVTKNLIAIIVAVGLVMAARSALNQWRIQRDTLEAQVEELEKSWLASEDSVERAEIRRNQQRLQASVPRLENLRGSRILIAIVLYAIGLIPSSFVLHRALNSLGEYPRWSTIITAQLLGHVGKYVPGKAMVIVLRATVLSRDRVRPMPATISVFLETFLMMAVGAAVAGVVTVWMPVPRWITLTTVIISILASVPTLPPILRLVASRFTAADLSGPRSGIGWRLFFAGWGWSVLSWILIGAAFTSLVTAIPAANPLPPLIQMYAIATAAISLAMVVGFASLLPGGAGVRELVLTTVLGASIGPVHGLLAAIAARITFMVVEAVLACGCWIWLRQFSAK